MHKMARPALGGLFLTGLFIATMFYIQFSTADLAGNDGYYHIKMAQLMRAGGLKVNFPWLPISILNTREFSDHHFLFHVALIPFTFGDLRLGAKLAGVLFASIPLLVLGWILHREKTPYVALWASGLLAISPAFLYRMSMVRTQSLSLVILLLGIYLLLRQRYILLLPLAFLYVWLYDAFPLLFVVVGAYSVAMRMSERRWDIRPILYVAIGTGLGLLINPYFPNNIVFVYRHILPKLGGGTEIRVGNEWYPYTTTELLKNGGLAIVAFLSGVMALGLTPKRIQVRTATAFFISLVFGFLLFQSRRFIEYYPPFALLFTAFAWTPVLENSTQEDDLNVSKMRGHLPVIILALMLGMGMLWSVNGARADMKGSKPYTRYAAASIWLAYNTPPGERVFQTDWDDFPRLFYYNTYNTYLIGLDPTYLLIYDRELYDLWVDITEGEIEQPAEVIVQRFGAHTIFSDLRHADFLTQAAADPMLREVYRDEEAVIYNVAH